MADRSRSPARDTDIPEAVLPVDEEADVVPPTARDAATMETTESEMTSDPSEQESGSDPHDGGVAEALADEADEAQVEGLLHIAVGPDDAHTAEMLGDEAR